MDLDPEGRKTYGPGGSGTLIEPTVVGLLPSHKSEIKKKWDFVVKKKKL
jgi:hypothetical protein